MHPIYTIKIQAFLMSDDDGISAPTAYGSSDVAFRINQINNIYASAGIQFAFNPISDAKEIASTLLNREFTILDPPDVGIDRWSKKPKIDERSHDDAREHLASLFPHKLVIFFRKRSKFEQNATDSTRKVVGAGGSSDILASHVNMPRNYGSPELLAHEIGHYLQLPHTFLGGIKTISDAAAAINKYVLDEKHPTKEGFLALDGDRSWVLDTPADSGKSIFRDAKLPECGGASGEVPIPVDFITAEGIILKPDRSNIMSYFFDCDLSIAPIKTISPQQGRRIRDGLEMGLRQELVTIESNPFYKIQKKGSTSGLVAFQHEIVQVRAGRVATALRAGTGNLQLDIWDVSDDGLQVKNTGQATAGAIGRVALAHLGLGLLATAVIASNLELKVILWQTNEIGKLTRKGSAVVAGKINDVAACTVGVKDLVTASRLDNGTMRVDLWSITASGEIVHLDSKSTGAINVPMAGKETPSIKIDRLGRSDCITFVRDTGNDLKPIRWRVDNSELKRLGAYNLGEAPVQDIAACSIAREVAVSAIRDQKGRLKLNTWFCLDREDDLETRASAHGGAISDIAVCRLGSYLICTGVRTGSGKLKLNFWHIAKDGNNIVRRKDIYGQICDEVEMCPA